MIGRPKPMRSDEGYTTDIASSDNCSHMKSQSDPIRSIGGKAVGRKGGKGRETFIKWTLLAIEFI